MNSHVPKLKVTNIINSLLHLSLGHLCLLPACGINILSGLPKMLLLILLPGMNIKKKLLTMAINPYY